MELIRGLHNLRARHRGCVATMGAFDGVHHGHQKVLSQLLQKSKELGLPSVVIVFEPLPREYFAPVKSPARLMSFRERYLALSDCGIHSLLRIRFDEMLSRMPAQDFIQRVFVEGLDIRYIVVGDDLRFGRDREGDFSLLKTAGDRYGFDVVDTRTQKEDGERISSTRVREALESDDLELAERLLGRPYTICGKVIVGQQLGRTLDVPTANLRLKRYRAALSGVYAVEVSGFDERTIPGVANIGTRPTVDDSVKAILEVHLLDFNENLYGKMISVSFKKKIRDEKKFSSLDELKTNIAADVDYGKRYFGLL